MKKCKRTALNYKKKLLKLNKQFIVLVFVFSIILPELITFVYAAPSPWNQTDWSGGGGQTTLTDNTKFYAASNVNTTTSGQATLNNTEKLSNIGFETDLTGWNTNTIGVNDNDLVGSSGLVASWPLDDTDTAQSYARVVNPAVASGRNIVINGGFDSDTIWTKGTGWTITAGGVAHQNGTNVAESNLQQTIPLITGKVYSVTFTISNFSAGQARPTLGGSGTGDGTWRSANGTYTETRIATGTTFRIVAGVGFIGDIDNVSVTQINIPASNSTPTQLLADGDMETSGTGSWSAGGFGSLSKQGSAHGGSQVLRVTNDGTHLFGNASQTVVTVGNVYRVTGYARSDGTSTPKVLGNGASTSLWTGTTSTSWQPFDFVYVPTSTGINLQALLSVGGANYAEFDDVVVSPDNYIRSGELAPDGDMETADTSYWISTSGTLSKETGTPHGGSRVMRIAYNGTNNPRAYQLTTFTGKKYRMTGWARGDGTYYPRVALPNSGSNLWVGTTSTSWQYFDVTNVIDSTDRTSFLLYSNVTGAGGFVEFDDVSFTEVDPLVGKPTNGVVLGSSSAGHLSNAYTFDGVNDVVNIYSSDLNSAFNPNEGTLVAWAKYTGNWSDGIWRDIMILTTGDGTNAIELAKSSINNQLNLSYKGGNVAISINKPSITSTDWFQVVLSWSKANDEVKAYFNGVQYSTTRNSMPTWTGNFSSTGAGIGGTGNGSLPWSGQINDVRLYRRALSASEILALYNGVTAIRDTAVHYADSASTKLTSTASYTGTFTQQVNVGDTNNYALSTFAYIDGSTAVNNTYAQLFYNGTLVPTTYTSVGGGWYKLSGSVVGVASNTGTGVQIMSGKTVYLDNISLTNYPSIGTLTSSIFDSGFGSNWGIATYGFFTPANTSVTVKIRTSNDATMTGAPDFSTCSAISTGSDISTNNCVTDGHRYAQYEVTLSSTSNFETPTFSDFNLLFSVADSSPPDITLNPITPDPLNDNTPVLTGNANDTGGLVTAVEFQIDSTISSWTNCTATDGTFSSSTEDFVCSITTPLSDGTHTIYTRATDNNTNTTTASYVSDTFTIDTTAPLPISLNIPENNSYTSSERPIFKWKATSDVTAGISKYVLEIDNPTLGVGSSSGDFVIDNIPTNGTNDYVTSKYVIHYENFNDADDTNDYILVYTKSSSDWSADSINGELREGKINWTVKAIDYAGNERSALRTLLVDQTSPTTTITKINDTAFSSNVFSTTDKTPTISGELTDPLSGANNGELQGEYGPEIASGPNQLEIKIEKKAGLIYQLVTLYTINIDSALWSCDDTLITDNLHQKCNKYFSFDFTSQQTLELGTYKITVKGKDNVNNSSSENIFTLNIVTADKLTTDLNELVETPNEENKEIEITKPEEYKNPSILKNLGANITKICSQIFNTFRNLLSDISIHIKLAFKDIGSNITLAYNKAGQGLNYIGNKVNEGFNITTNSISTAFANFGQRYDQIKNNARGVTKSILLAVSKRITITENRIAKGLSITEKVIETTAKNMNKGLHTVGNVIAQGFNKTNDATKKFAGSITLAIGDTAKNISNGIGNQIIKLGYLFTPEPTQISDVQVVIISPTSAKITWKTNTLANGKVNYGLDETYSLDIQSDEQLTYHEFLLTNLTPDTEYHFEVMSQGKNYVYDANRKFKTPLTNEDN